MAVAARFASSWHQIPTRRDRHPTGIARTCRSPATRDVRPERPRARDCNAHSCRTEHESARRPPFPLTLDRPGSPQVDLRENWHPQSPGTARPNLLRRVSPRHRRKDATRRRRLADIAYRTRCHLRILKLQCAGVNAGWQTRSSHNRCIRTTPAKIATPSASGADGGEVVRIACRRPARHWQSGLSPRRTDAGCLSWHERRRASPRVGLLWQELAAT